MIEYHMKEDVVFYYLLFVSYPVAFVFCSYRVKTAGYSEGLQCFCGNLSYSQLQHLESVNNCTG